METRLGGEGADARVTGAYATHGRQHIDFDTTQEHAAPNTTSDLAFRGVLQGRSTAVWKGNIIVDPGAQKTDAFQESRNLLISKRAHADAIPGLEIQANDVRCTHAAAVAQVDPEQLFYLRSRGLPEDVAKRLVIEGFLSALVERFEAGPVREVLADALERRLGLILDGCTARSARAHMRRGAMRRIAVHGSCCAARPPRLRQVRPCRPGRTPWCPWRARPRRRAPHPGPRRGHRATVDRVAIGGGARARRGLALGQEAPGGRRERAPPGQAPLF